MITYEQFCDIIESTKEKFKDLFFLNDDILTTELEKDIILTYLMLKIKYLQKCKNTLITLNGFIDSNINSNKITNLNTFLNTFCTLNYKIGNSWKSQKLYTQDIKPKVAKDSGIYIEVPYEIKDAKEMYLTFNIRNYVYKYVLK